MRVINVSDEGSGEKARAATEFQMSNKSVARELLDGDDMLVDKVIVTQNRY